MPFLRMPYGKDANTDSKLRDSTSSYDRPPSYTRSTKSTGSRRLRSKRRRTVIRAADIQASGNNTINGNNLKGNFTAGSSFSKPPFFPPSPCKFFKCIIEDNDPAVHYSGAWVLNGTQVSTTHSTTDSDAKISLRFNGSGIVVFGIVPQSSDEQKPPTAVYKIDNQMAFTTTLPLAEAPIMNQPLFASTGQLSSDDEHLLTIDVTHADTPYTIANFFVVPPSNVFKDMMMVTPQNSSVTTTSSSAVSSRTMNAVSTSSSTAKLSENSQETIRILAGFLALITCLMIAGGVVFYIKWRNNMKEKAKQKILMPVVSCPQAEKARPDTVYTSFTTTESILRNDEYFWSPAFRSPRSNTRSDGPRSDSRSRSASDGRRSVLDLSPPPLPPKPVLFGFTPQTKLAS